MKEKTEKTIVGAVGTILVVGLILGIMFVSRFFNAATLHTQVINPVNGVQCVVVSATDSTSVDCWKVNTRD